MEGGYDYASGIVIDSQNNIYISGTFTQCSNSINDPYYAIPRIGDNNGLDYTSTTSTNTSCQREFIAKFSNVGIFQWIHYPYEPLSSNAGSAPYTMRISRNFHIVNDVIYWIVSLQPGNYEGGVFSNTNTTLPFLYYVLKYDVNGTFISATPIDLELSGYTSAELRWYRNPYNGYYYAVYWNNNSITATAGGNSLNAGLPKILCFNEQGVYQWHRESAINTLSLISLDFDPQGAVYLVGTTSSTSNGNFLGWTAYGSGSGATCFVMKCNADMTTYNWVTNYTTSSVAGAAQNIPPQAYYNTFTDEVLFGGIIGTSYFNWGTQTETGPGANNGSDALLARFNSTTGACIDMHRLVGNNGYNDGFTKIIQDNNGDLIFGGYMGYQLTDSNNVNYYSYGGNSDFFITKFAAQACTPLSSESFDKAGIDVYPNPVKDILQVSVTENVIYKLYDLLGKELQKGNLTPAENSIDMSGFEKGMYLLNVNGYSFKVVKE